MELLVGARILGQAFPEHLGCRLSAIILQALHIYLSIIRGMDDNPNRSCSSNNVLTLHPVIELNSVLLINVLEQQP
jgi:hypothetical protein